MSPQAYDEYLSPEIDPTVHKVLKDTLPYFKDLQDIPSQIDRLAKLIDADGAFLTMIAKAHNHVLEGTSPDLQIKELYKMGFITSLIQNKLNAIRTKHNISKHEESSWKKFKIADVEELRDQIIYVIEWFYTECPVGPHLESIFIPHNVISVSVGHIRTMVSLVKVNVKGVKEVTKMRTLSSLDFMSSTGFYALCSLIDQYSLEENIDGISIGIAANVEVDGHINGAFHTIGWPERLLKSLKDRFTNVKITLLNDAVGYAYGVERCDLVMPIITLTLGDGVGCALIQKDSIIGKELEVFPIDGKHHIHQYLGALYFQLESLSAKWDFITMRNEYSSRIIKSLKLLKERFDFKSVILGGGRSVFCDGVIINTEMKKIGITVNIQSEDNVILKGLANYWNQFYYIKKS